MEEMLNGMTGKHVDVLCSGAVSLRGEVVKVTNGLVEMRDEDDQTCFIALDKIVVVWEARDKEPRAGFLAGAMNKH